MNGFTKGEWELEEDSFQEYWCEGTHYSAGPALAIYKKEDAELIATAGTTATKLAEQGYDAVKVLELLPELVRVIQDLPSDELIGEALRETLEQCRRVGDDNRI